MAKYGSRLKPWPAGAEAEVINALRELSHIEEILSVLRREAIRGKRKRLLGEWFDPLQETAANLGEIGHELEYYSMEYSGRMAWKSATKKLLQVAKLISEYLESSQVEYKRNNYKGVGIYFEWIEAHILTMREELTRVPFENDVVREAEKIAREALNNGRD